jgi:hypothetical protein
MPILLLGFRKPLPVFFCTTLITLPARAAVIFDPTGMPKSKAKRSDPLWLTMPLLP